MNSIAPVPRPRGDHDARRSDVARTVLRVLGEQGFLGLTMRAVAAEMGASTGVITHYFASKRELQTFALDVLAQGVEERQRPPASTGAAGLRTLLLGMLPLSAETATANRIWISSWDLVLADAQLTGAHAKSYAASRARLEAAIRAAQDSGDLVTADAGDLAATVHAFTLGLTVQAVLDPDAFPADHQVALTDAFLDGLSPGGRERVSTRATSTSQSEEPT